MYGLKIRFKYAEAAKKNLIQNNLFDTDYHVEKTKDHIIFPCKKAIVSHKKDLFSFFPDAEIVELHFKRRKPQHYKEWLEIESSMLPSSYDLIGTIAIVEINTDQEKWEQQIAWALLKTHSNIKTILKKKGIHKGEFRTQKLEYLAGVKTKVTTHKENGVKIMLDVESVYFSPRLATERKRIYKQVKTAENVLVMFSGCGPYVIEIAKNTGAKEVYGIEKNPIAHKFAERNVAINRLDNVVLYLGDVRQVIPGLGSRFERIIMPLPKGGEDFLDLAISSAKKGATIHFYDFEQESDFEKAVSKAKEACRKARIKCKVLNIIKCGQYAPGKYRLCVDFVVQ